MKISELIFKLELLKAEHGDAECCTEYDGIVNSFESEEVFYGSLPQEWGERVDRFVGVIIGGYNGG